MALPIFAITIFVSAFLLFLVQPLVGKLILPKLGGTPQVWNTCMVFFQSVLLLGYAYTHSVSTRLKLRHQLMLHGALLAVPILMLYFFPLYITVVGDDKTEGWSPPPGSNPVFNTLGLLCIIIGVPFFVVSTSAPLLQKWFAYSGHVTAKDPYYLYSVSNLGSLLSLFLYPALVEPFTFLQDQANIWFGGYILLAVCILYCAYMIHKTAPSDDEILAHETAASTVTAPSPETPAPPPMPAPAPAVETSTAVKSGQAPGGPRGIQRKKGVKAHGKAEDEKAAPRPAAAPLIARGATADMSAWRRIRWVLLAAVPSSMMLGVTSYISTDLSPFPLVWIIPLGLYLLSFILVYEKSLKWTEKRYQIMSTQGYTLHQMMVYVAQPMGVLALCFVALTRNFDPVSATILTMFGFFANALACHGELAEDRPSTKHLTEYFLLMSVGGMVGGFFNGIIAPIVFQQGILEFYIVIVVACMVRPNYVPTGWFDDLILNAFPQFQGWVRNQGDEMAKSMGRPAPRTTYLFSYFLDIVFGLFILSIAYWLTTGTALGWVFKTLKVTQEWRVVTQRLVLFGIPMVFCFFFAGRPLRMSLSVAGLLLGIMYFGASGREPLAQRRTYFGVLRVEQGRQYPADDEEKLEFKRAPVKGDDGKFGLPPYSYTFLMHGTTYHGRNYRYNPADKGHDLSRLATTYYHRYGPVGVVMERDNWFKGRQNTYYADVRLSAALIGDIMGAAGAGFNAALPALTQCWSETPFATIGLGTGTMASYARPFQHMTYYEIDDVIRSFSLPETGEEAYFTFLQGAIRRGVNLEIIMGDARLSLEPKREPKNLENSSLYFGDYRTITDPEISRSYAKAPYKDQPAASPNREKYYRAINVDAFSSDAIPIHLVTKQAIAIYMSKLRDDGVLCVHTSNRHMDLVRPVARIAMELSRESQKEGAKEAESMTFKDDKEREAFLKMFEINCLVGKDPGSSDDEEDSRRRGSFFMGHYGSEYVMIFRGDGFSKYLKELEAKKKLFMDNAREYQKLVAEKKDGQAPVPEPDKIMFTPGGHAPKGWEILNSPVEWFNPYEDQFFIRQDGRRFQTHEKVTDRAPLWTDDYSNILSVVRWHWPWQ